MDYLAAQKRLEDHRHLLDRTYHGKTVDELLIAPLDTEEFSHFSDQYILSLDGKFALQPYLKSDLQVIAVLDRYELRDNGFFFQIEVGKLVDLLGE